MVICRRNFEKQKLMKTLLHQKCIPKPYLEKELSYFWRKKELLKQLQKEVMYGHILAFPGWWSTFCVVVGGGGYIFAGGGWWYSLV